MENRYKVSFVQQIEKNEYEIESLWCIKDRENFIVDNIPFIAKRVSLGDTIKSEYDEDEQAFYFADFVSVSGNTTVRLYFKNGKDIEITRDYLNKKGCESEVFLERKIVAVNIPQIIDYKAIKSYLDEGENDGIWSYEESCLAHDLTIN